MKKFLKIFAVSLCLILMVSALVACQNKCDSHVDENGDLKCDKCGADMSDDSACKHVDADFDEKCDKCGADVILNDGKMTYSVTIGDGNGEVYPDIIVDFYQNGESVAMKPTNADGKVYIRLVAGNYTLDLIDTKNRGLYYGTNLEVTASAPNLTITASKEVSSFNTERIYGSLDRYSTENAYVLEGEGAFHLSVTSNGKIPFIWYPKITGIYTISFECDFDVLLTSNGSPNNVLANDIVDSKDRISDSSFKIKIDNTLIASVEAQRKTTPHLIVLDPQVSSGSGILKITKTGEAPVSIYELPWDVYRAELPGELNITASTTQSDFTYVKLDGSDRAVYNSEDGLYHLNSKDGAVLYIQLIHTPTTLPAAPAGEEQDYFTFKALAENGEFGVYIYNEDGTFKEKKSYHEHLNACLEYAKATDNNAGVYYLTEGMVEGVKLFGDKSGWWNFGSLNHIFGDKSDAVDPNYAWMFAVCYLA